jgi:hypothetical protein
VHFEYLDTEEKTGKAGIYIWKEIHKEIKDILHDLRGTVLLIHDSLEFTDFIDLLNKIRPGCLLDVLYISLIRSYGFMKQALDLKPLDEKRIFIMDCVSGFAFPPEEGVDDVLYHKPPRSLLEFKEIINCGVEKTNPDIIVFDSLSQFINFSHPSDEELKELYGFLKTIRKLSAHNTFVLLYDNKMGLMRRLPRKDVDMILKLEIVKEEPEWIYQFADKILRI